MGFFDSLFSDGKGKSNGVPGYLKKDYERYGLDPDNEGGRRSPNEGKKMYCTRCRRIYVNGYVICPDCRNNLVEWK